MSAIVTGSNPLSNFDEINPIIENASMVCHFGAIVDELPFNELLGPNFIGSYNVWEASKKHGVKRVIYASSIHAVGMNPRTVTLKPDTPHRPDSFYGLAKCFTEDLAKMYFEKNKFDRCWKYWNYISLQYISKETR